MPIQTESKGAFLFTCFVRLPLDGSAPKPTERERPDPPRLRLAAAASDPPRLRLAAAASAWHAAAAGLASVAGQQALTPVLIAPARSPPPRTGLTGLHQRIRQGAPDAGCLSTAVAWHGCVYVEK